MARFRDANDETGRDSMGKRRGWEEGLTVRVLLSSYDLAVDGDDEAARKFSSVRRRNGGEARCSGLPVLGVDVEEEDRVEAVPRASSVELTVLHGAPTTVSLSL